MKEVTNHRLLIKQFIFPRIMWTGFFFEVSVNIFHCRFLLFLGTITIVSDVDQKKKKG